MNTLLTLYLGGFPVAFSVLMWAFNDLPPDDDFLDTWAGIAATAIFIILWPLFLAICLYDAITER